MKITLTLVFIITLSILAFLFYLGYQSRTTIAPGLSSGKLTQCPNTPNCVCSEIDKNLPHFIAPIPFEKSSHEKIFSILKQEIQDLGGEVIIEKNNYLAAIFVSSIFRFVDDFEIRIDVENNTIHIRSASRVGRSDMNVNRSRVEKFRTKILNQLK